MNASNRYSMPRLFKVFIVGCFVITAFQVSYVWGQGTCSTVYTTDNDFQQGNLVNVNLDTPNQLELNEQTAPPPFIWVACSNRGTVVRIDVETGQIIGEYWSAPQNRYKNPSRTTVDLYGNVWVGNRDESSSITIDGVTLPRGSVVKIGVTIGGTRCNADGSANASGDYLKPPFTYNTCVDRNGDGLIKTSRGLGDIRAWSNSTGVDHDGGVATADDEAILVYTRTTATTIRHVSIDADNNVWVGGHTTSVPSKFNKLNGNTGAILSTFPSSGNAPCGGYGGLIDGNGILWSASLTQYSLLRYDIANNSSTCISLGGRYSYGLAVDNNGYIWNSHFSSRNISKISPDGVVQPGFPKLVGGEGCRGVAVTSDNNIWVANSGSATVSRLDNNGNIRKTISVGSTPTGVAVDANGKVWVTNLVSNSVMRIDPNEGSDGLGAVDLTVGLGTNAGPYNYSDMTGAVAIGATSLQGSWNVVNNSGNTDTDWGKVSWTEDLPTGTDIKVEVRAANNEAGLAGETFFEVTNGESFCETGVTGQYIEIRATLSREANVEGTPTPTLYDLTVEQCDNEAPVISCPANIEQGTDEGACNAVVTWTVTATDNCDIESIVCTPASGSTFEKGETTVNCVATDWAGNESECSFTVTVKDNEAPAISCPADIEVNTEEGVCTAVATWDITATDNCGIESIVCDPPSGSTFEEGTTTVNCVATDESGNESTCSFTVTVVDNEDPTITLSVSPTELWPPNHKMVTITATVETDDNCEGYTYELVSIVSDEDDDGLGDGDAEDDIQNEETGTADLSFKLRAERAGMGDGRTYTITYKVTDAAGNETEATATVFVPKSRGKISVNSNENNYIAVYPNPVDEKLYIDLSFIYSDNIKITIMDILGNTIMSVNESNISSMKKQINMQDFTAGTYFVRIQFGQEQYIERIIKK